MHQCVPKAIQLKRVQIHDRQQFHALLQQVIWIVFQLLKIIVKVLYVWNKYLLKFCLMHTPIL